MIVQEVPFDRTINCKVTPDLHEVSKAHAASLDETLSRYGRCAIRLLLAASRHGFNMADTRIEVGEGQTPISIPSLSVPVPQELTPWVRWGIQVSNGEYAGLAAQAGQFDMTLAQRVRRALHFRNFIMTAGASPYTPVFIHKGKRILVPVSSLNPHTDLQRYQLKLSPGLYEATRQGAKIAHERLALYGREAIRLFSAASQYEFNASTVLLSPQRKPIHLPSFATLPEELQQSHRPTGFLVSPTDKASMAEKAGQANISVAEYSRQALRFRNFIIEVRGTSDVPVFIHRDQEVGLE